MIRLRHRTQIDIILPEPILPVVAADEIRQGRLPHVQTDVIMLAKSEICYFVERALLVREREMITGFTGGNSGWSFRVVKGVNYRVGRRKGEPVRETVVDTTKGLLCITNSRVMFVARSNGFDIKLQQISAVLPFSNAICIQVGNTSYSVMLPNADLALQLLQVVI